MHHGGNLKTRKLVFRLYYSPTPNKCEYLSGEATNFPHVQKLKIMNS
jgi:hypothetical protein